MHLVPVPDVMGLAEIAQRLGVSKSWARRLSERRDFPDGQRLTMGQVWDTADVEAYIARRWPAKAR